MKLCGVSLRAVAVVARADVVLELDAAAAYRRSAAISSFTFAITASKSA